MNNVVRINITIPVNILNELEEFASPRGKSGFVAQAVEEKLRREKREEALKRQAKMSDAFPQIKDGAEYIAKTRKKEDKERGKRLHICPLILLIVMF